MFFMVIAISFLTPYNHIISYACATVKLIEDCI